MPTSNLSVTMGYKGSGKPNGIAAYHPDGAVLLGGFMASDDAQTAYFGRLVSANAASTPDGKFYCGIPSGYVPVGVIIYHAGIAQNDPAKPDSFIAGQPITVMNMGTFWLASWTKTSVGSIDPTVDSVVVANNLTGAIEFMPKGSSAQTGWTVINASVRSVSNDTSGAMLFVNI